MKKLLPIFAILCMISFNGISQRKGWNKFPSKEAKDTVVVDTLKGEGILTDTTASVILPVEVITPGTKISNVPTDILTLDEAYLKSTKNNPQIEGFTILLYSSSGANSRLSARNIQIEFREMFPDYVTHLSWKSPNYEVRIGDFRTKIEAEKVLQEISKTFPMAFIKADWIELPELPELED